MATKYLHVIGVDPGGTTGWCLFTIPRESIFGQDSSKIIQWDFGEFTGPLAEQAVNLARLSREIQSLDYKQGPALVVEDWTVDPTFKSLDSEALSPIRLGAMLVLLKKLNQLADATVTFQNRSQAKQTITDERLHRSGYWVKGSDHIRDATRHAITALRRAADSEEFAEKLWPSLTDQKNQARLRKKKAVFTNLKTYCCNYWSYTLNRAILVQQQFKGRQGDYDGVV